MTFLTQNWWENHQGLKKVTQNRIGPQGPSGLNLKVFHYFFNVRASFVYFGYSNLVLLCYIFIIFLQVVNDAAPWLTFGDSG